MFREYVLLPKLFRVLLILERVITVIKKVNALVKVYAIKQCNRLIIFVNLACIDR